MLRKVIGMAFGMVALLNAQAGLGPIQPPKGQPINEVPKLGLGTFALFDKDSGLDALVGAVEKGFRHFDAAAIYRNEDRVGAGISQGLKRTGLKREDIWVTTKLWNNRHGKLAEQGLRESLQRLNLTYVDLFLIHFPVDQTIPAPYRFDPVETWKEMEKLVRPGGPVRFIGVSNFSPKQMKEVLAAATIKPKVHQFELHPYLQQTEFVEWHEKNGIQVIGYAPLGNTSPYYRSASMENPSHPPILTSNPTLKAIGKERGCSAAQVALAWNIKRGVVVIPKAAKLEHQTENLDVEKCKLTDEDMKKIAGISAQYSGRFNNPCKRIKMPCYEGLTNTSGGT